MQIKTVNVGSESKLKVEAVSGTMFNYFGVMPYNIIPKKVFSGVSEQPMGLEETLSGAINRALNSFGDCDLSVGIESGMMRVSAANSGFMELTACALYDGKKFYPGLSSAFELPRDVTRIITEQNKDVNYAVHSAGLTNSQRIGDEEGIIGILTKMRVTRKDQIKQALTMALVQIENLDAYSR